MINFPFLYSTSFSHFTEFSSLCDVGWTSSGLFFAFRASWERVYLWFPFLSLCRPISSRGTVNVLDFTPYKSKPKWRRGSLPTRTFLCFPKRKYTSTVQRRWIIHRGKVYDVSEFLGRHPGGKVILLPLTRAYGVDDIREISWTHDFWAVYKTGMGTRGRGNWDACVGT